VTSKKAILDRHLDHGGSWNPVVLGDSGTYRARAYVLNVILLLLKKHLFFSIILLLLGTRKGNKTKKIIYADNKAQDTSFTLSW